MVDLAVGVAVDDPGEHVSDIAQRLDAIGLAGFDERGDDGPLLGTAVGAGEERILAVERKVIGVFRDEDVGNHGLRRDAALDEPGGRRPLYHHLLAGPARVFRPTRHDHAELGRHDVEAFGKILADGMQRAPAAGAGLVLDVDDLLATRQVDRQ